MSFPRLRESSNEAKDVHCLRKNNADTLLLASMASESEFRKQAHNYSSILISTHGDFCSKNPIATDLKPVACDEGMSQNIIAFAGVNAYLRNKNFDATNTCDGLLSAKELASLDLSSCKLFTISACQSALGEITPDGVFGLQRGLKNAGVDAMILSLWNVNSDATAMMMRELYSNIDRNMSIRQAFNEARKALFEPDKSAVSEVKYVFDPATMSTVAVKSDTSVSYDTPQYTNAFVLIDALE